MGLQNKMSYLVVMATAIFAAIFAIEQVYNYDLWWHLKYGDWVLENKEILRKDIFSFSTYGAMWINTAWLGSVLFSAIKNLAGLDALIIFKAIIIGLGFGGGCYYLVKKGLNPYVAALLIGYAVVTARFRFLLRPLVFMFPFTVMILWILSEETFTRKKILILSLPLTVIWANLHGSAYLAPVFSGLLLLESFALWLWNRFKSISLPFPSFELALTLCLCIAVLLTPFSIDSLKLTLDRFLFQDIIARTYTVQEHLPLEWDSHKMFWWLLFATGFSFLITWRQIRFFSLFVFLATGWLAISSMRYAGIVALVHVLLLGKNLISSPLQIAKNYRAKPVIDIALSVILIAAGLFAYHNTFKPTKEYQWGLGINEKKFPIRAVKFLQNQNFSGNLFNSWKDGGYILYNLPNAKTFIDGRGLSEQIALWGKMSNMSHHEIQRYLELNKVQTALLNNSDNSLINFFELAPQFNLIYLDDHYSVFSRDLKNDNSPAQSMKFKFIRLQGFDFKYLEPLAASDNIEQIENEFERALVQFPNNFSVVFQYALFLDLLNRPEAVDYYLKAARINPSLGFSHFNLAIAGGRAALKYQRWDEGAELLKISLKYGEVTPEIHFLLATAQYQLGDYESAVKHFKSNLKLKPDSVVTLTNLGFLYIDTKKYAKAKQTFSKAVKLEPKFEGAYYGHALALENNHDPSAGKAWQVFLQYFPESKWAPMAKKYLSRSQQK